MFNPQRATICSTSSIVKDPQHQITVRDRIGSLKRVTNEMNVEVELNLDGVGSSDSSTGIPFLDHMLDQLASHGLFDVHVKAVGDTHIDDHHTIEDVGLAIGINRQHSKLLQELLEKRHNMIHDVVAQSLAQKGYCPALKKKQKSWSETVGYIKQSRTSRNSVC
ncbi:hypothetical protein L1987_30191 [Smallanthus sonchifolius]|uniref:Uncharacterized protein n=1 Tax=Smallanthus sonchifolius TaxID=185202 RepID=A0ACB9I2S0_9ASTR|nr:hypothetical protein L1987_30191 [Smallanthus sonchifolius]